MLEFFAESNSAARVYSYAQLNIVVPLVSAACYQL